MMLKKILFILFFSTVSYGQVVINELDADTPSTDKLEFIELKSDTPNFPLDGYVLVFFNGSSTGSTSTSYMAIDLDGYTTDLNGIFHLGNTLVSPSPILTITDSSIQNGPDAVALYQGNASDFPDGTLATSTNLKSALAYSNGTTAPSTLMTALNLSTFINENQTLKAATVSIQRKNDGTYELKAPTPGANNDGTGVVFNAITTSVNPNRNLLEGETFEVVFTTQTPVSSNDLMFSFSIVNGNFDIYDYSGNFSVTIPVGQTTATKTIQLTDDTLDEGDEFLKITIGSIPSGYVLSNNNKIVRVNDNDYEVKPWGTPLNPTYNLCPNLAPSGYYDSLEGKSGNQLKQVIQDIIANPSVVREHSYADVWEMLKQADVNPENGSQVWLMYVERPSSKVDQQTGTSGAVGFWNREHIYCQSRGNFSLDPLAPNDGINVWTTTDANDITAGGADGHHLRAEDSPENTVRNNRNYGVDYNGPSGNAGSWRGDVARAIFYMAVRYNGLNVVNGDVSETPTGYIGDLNTLLSWNTLDKADDFEMNRNNVIYNWQKNRNPFIDYPLLAEYVFGSHFGETWYASMSNPDFNLEWNVSLYPNPAQNYIVIGGLRESTPIEIYSAAGIKVYEGVYFPESQLNLNLSSGIYMLKMTQEGRSTTKKLIIK